MPKLEAIKEIRYGGKTVKPGETFDVLDKDVKILKAIKKAKEPEAAAAPPKTQKRPTAKVETKAADAVDPKPPEATQPWVAPATPVEPMTTRDDPAGRYRRRDMKPED